MTKRCILGPASAVLIFALAAAPRAGAEGGERPALLPRDEIAAYAIPDEPAPAPAAQKRPAAVKLPPPDPRKARAAERDAAKTAAAKPDVAKPDVAKPDVARTEAAKTEAAKPEPAKPEPAKAEASLAGAARIDAARTGALTVGSSRARAGDAEQARIEILRALVERHAAENGIPFALAHGVIRMESRYNAGARNGPHLGLTQINAATARSLGYAGDAAGLLDPDTNLRYGLKYLARAYLLAKGDSCGALQRYRGGHRSVEVTPATRVYCARVMTLTASAR